MSAEANGTVATVITNAAGQPVRTTVGTTSSSRSRATTTGPSVDTHAGSGLPEPARLDFRA
jgi:hypothetical protein